MSQDHYREVVQQSQDAFKEAVDTWVRTVQDAVSSVSVPGSAQLTDPQQTVDEVFEFAERMLSVQRDFTRNLVQNAFTAQQTRTRQGDTAEAAGD